MSTHNLCFALKYENIGVFYLKIFQFLEMKFSIYLNRRVFVMKFSCLGSLVMTKMFCVKPCQEFSNLLLLV